MKSNKAFCEDLRKWAEEYVGNVGAQGDSAIAENGESFVVYGWPHHNQQQTEYLWSHLIIALQRAEQARKPEGVGIKEGWAIPPVLYWRLYPAIEKDWGGQFYTRLLISKT